MPSFHQLVKLCVIVSALGEEEKLSVAPSTPAPSVEQQPTAQPPVAQPLPGADAVAKPSVEPAVAPQAADATQATVPPASAEAKTQAAQTAPADTSPTENGGLPAGAPPAESGGLPADEPPAETKGMSAEASPAEKAAADDASKDSPGELDGQTSDSDEGAQPEEPEKERDEDGVIEVVHTLPQQQADSDNFLSLAMVPAMAALMSFGGIIAYTMIFLFKILRRRTRGQGASGKAVHTEDLDFEDLEVALNMSATNTPVSRKRNGSYGLVEEPEKPSKEDSRETQATECTLSDDGWGDDGWGNEGWDDLDDCEADIDAVTSPLLASKADRMVPSQKAPPKGKAD